MPRLRRRAHRGDWAAPRRAPKRLGHRIARACSARRELSAWRTRRGRLSTRCTRFAVNCGGYSPVQKVRETCDAEGRGPVAAKSYHQEQKETPDGAHSIILQPARECFASAGDFPPWAHIKKWSHAPRPLAHDWSSERCARICTVFTQRSRLVLRETA